MLKYLNLNSDLPILLFEELINHMAKISIPLMNTTRTLCIEMISLLLL